MDPTVILPILAASSVVLLLVLKIYIKIRAYFPIVVECWFCCKYSKVPFRSSNCWNCPHCEQYNGFTEDGGYNQLIPAQHDEFLNVPLSASKTSPQVKYLRRGPTLCPSCNCNQQLKVAQLAAFVPMNPKNYDSEIEQYSRQLEKVYNICSRCEATVSEVFKKQKKMYSSTNNQRTNGLLKTGPLSNDETVHHTTFTTYSTILLCTLLLICVSKSILSDALLNDYTKHLIDSKILPNWLLNDGADYFVFIASLTKYLNQMTATVSSSLPDAVAGTLFKYSDSVDYVLIGACIAIYGLELARQRNTGCLLNLGSWIILMSLRGSGTPWTFLVSLVQGLAATVFMFVSIGGIRARRKERLQRSVWEKRITPERTKKMHPVSEIGSVNSTLKSESLRRRSATAAVPEPPRTVTRSPPPPLSAPMSRKLSPTNTETPKHRPKDDFGLSDLKLGPRQQPSLFKNHLTAEPRPYCGRLNDRIWSKSAVLSPARFNADRYSYGGDINTTPSPPTRSSSPSSGLGSLASNQPMHPDHSGSFYHSNSDPFDRLSIDPDTAINHHNPYQLSTMSPSALFYDPYRGGELSPMTYYHFAAQFHRMYSSPNSVYSNSANNLLGDNLQCSPAASAPQQPSASSNSSFYNMFHNVVFPIAVLVLVFCNVSLLGFVYYKEFYASRRSSV